MNAAISGILRCSLAGVVILIFAGCVTLESGGVHGPGAVTELNGRLIRTYESGYRETLRAGVMALGQMGVPVVKELSDGAGTSIKAVLPDGTPVNVDIFNIGNGKTEVCARAGAAGVWDSRAAEQLHASIGEMISILPKPAAKPYDVQGGVENAPDKAAQAAEEIVRTSPPGQVKKQKAATTGGKNSSSDVSRRASAGPRPQFTLFFDADSNELSSGQMKMLDKIAKHILEIPNAKVKLNGYTDSLGNAGYNRMISEARASAVKFYLISRGVPPGNIKVTGYGPTNFIAENKTLAGRDRNRRVEIVISTPKHK